MSFDYSFLRNDIIARTNELINKKENVKVNSSQRKLILKIYQNELDSLNPKCQIAVKKLHDTLTGTTVIEKKANCLILPFILIKREMANMVGCLTGYKFGRINNSTFNAQIIALNANRRTNPVENQLNPIPSFTQQEEAPLPMSSVTLIENEHFENEVSYKNDSLEKLGVLKERLINLYQSTDFDSNTAREELDAAMTEVATLKRKDQVAVRTVLVNAFDKIFAIFDSEYGNNRVGVVSKDLRSLWSTAKSCITLIKHHSPQIEGSLGMFKGLINLTSKSFPLECKKFDSLVYSYEKLMDTGSPSISS